MTRTSADFSPLVAAPGCSSRRTFMKSLLLLGGAPLLAGRGLGVAAGRAKLSYQYRTMSVRHFPEMQAFIDGLREKNQLSRNQTFQRYIDPKRRNFSIPENFKEAKTLIVLAIPAPPLIVSFHRRGRALPVVLPPGYYDDGNPEEAILKAVREEIVRDPAARVEAIHTPHQKLAAVRSGLGAYGRNNICYVDGMGSFLSLATFLTDRELPEDHWRPLAMLPACRDCSICYGICPTGAISRDHFVIDVGKCITLYNEVPGGFPNFILPSMHNALMGCMRCQDKCPVNAPFAAPTRLEDVSEEETEKCLKGTPDDALIQSLSRKLKGFVSDKESFPVFRRNLKALLR